LRREEERVYYVAMMRPGEKLVIVTTGPETSFLDRVNFVLPERIKARAQLRSYEDE